MKRPWSSFAQSSAAAQQYLNFVEMPTELQHQVHMSIYEHVPNSTIPFERLPDVVYHMITDPASWDGRAGSGVHCSGLSPQAA